MPDPISNDLRERIVARYAEGYTHAQIADQLEVGCATVARILRRKRETGAVDPKPKGGGFPPRIRDDDNKAVRKLVSEMRDASVQEMCDEWRKRTGRPCSRSSFLRALRRFGYSFKKKSFSATEKNSKANKKKRAKFEMRIAAIDPRRFVFLDESGFNTKMAPLYGWGPQDERLRDQRPMGHHKNVSVIGAIRLDGPLALRTYETTVNAPVFREFLEEALCPRLRPGDIVVMDNLRAHHCAFVKPLVEARDADVLYLPPYSPELNPIEHIWAVVKRLVKKRRFKTVEDVRRGVRAAWRSISRLDLQETFVACGY